MTKKIILIMEAVNKIVDEYLWNIQNANEKIKKENIKMRDSINEIKNKYHIALSFSILEWLVLVLILIKLLFNV